MSPDIIQAAIQSPGLAALDHDDVVKDIRPQFLDFDDGVSFMEASCLGPLQEQETGAIPGAPAAQAQPMIQAPPVVQADPQVPVPMSHGLSWSQRPSGTTKFKKAYGNKWYSKQRPKLQSVRATTGAVHDIMIGSTIGIVHTKEAKKGEMTLNSYIVHLYYTRLCHM